MRGNNCYLIIKGGFGCQGEVFAASDYIRGIWTFESSDIDFEKVNMLKI